MPSCAEGRISSVFVDNHSVFDLSDPDLNMRFGWAYRLANRLHPATRQSVIRRELDGVRLIGGTGFTAKKVTFKVAHASKGAAAAIEAAGGKLDMPQAEKPADA